MEKRNGGSVEDEVVVDGPRSTDDGSQKSVHFSDVK
jgi:hypothetical protein